jgi:dimethylamine monooxygenase subunit A
MPWLVNAPFRMRPNLEKLDASSPALLVTDELFSIYSRERMSILAAHPKRATVGTPNLAALREVNTLASVGAACRDTVGSSAIVSRQAAPTAVDTALALQEDFVILKNESNVLRTEYLSVAFPSRWDPREKLGLDFTAIHAPVADNQMLLAAGPSIMAMAFMKQPMLRHVWLIVPSATLAQHPEQNDYSWSATLQDAAPLLPRLYFRVERQTTWPLPQFDRAVFFIRVMMSSLADVLQAAPNRARHLHDALSSMTPAVVAYRGMTDAMPRLLSELETFA